MTYFVSLMGKYIIANHQGAAGMLAHFFMSALMLFVLVFVSRILSSEKFCQFSDVLNLWFLVVLSSVTQLKLGACVCVCVFAFVAKLLRDIHFLSFPFLLFVSCLFLNPSI